MTIKNDEENLLRILSRNEIRKRNTILYKVAGYYGVNNYTLFNDYGYQGLYNETTNQIRMRKHLDYSQNILDYMGSEELFSNLFRIIQTTAILKKKTPSNWNYACQTHLYVGKKIRELINQIGGELPERLPTPKKSIGELEKEIILI